MKRLAVIVKPENVDGMISSLREMGLKATIYVKGEGQAEWRLEEGVAHLSLYTHQER
jgi:nitrogen regulatory protein PII